MKNSILIIFLAWLYAGVVGAQHRSYAKVAMLAVREDVGSCDHSYERAFTSFFNYINRQAAVCVVRKRDAFEEDNVRESESHDMQEFLHSTWRRYVLACLLASSLRLFGMEPQPTTSVSSYVNARSYAKAGCFPCRKQKKTVLDKRSLEQKNFCELVTAVKQGDSKTVYFYRLYGPIINFKDEHGYVPLHYAINALNVRISELLLHMPTIQLDVTTPQGITIAQLLEERLQKAQTEDEKNRAHQIIEIFEQCAREQQRKKDTYVYTCDIGNVLPYEDQEGRLWFYKDGERIQCGYVKKNQHVTEIDL